MDHSPYDERNYPIIGVKEGYARPRIVQSQQDVKALETGFDLHLVKPVEAAELVRPAEGDAERGR